MGEGVPSVEAWSVYNGDTVKGAEGAAHSADVLSLPRLASLVRRLTPSLFILSISFPLSPFPQAPPLKSMDGLILDLSAMSGRTSLNRTSLNRRPSYMNPPTATATADPGPNPNTAGAGARSTRSSTRATDTGSVASDGDAGLAGMTRSFFGLNRKPRRNSTDSGSSGTPPPPPGHPFNAPTSPRSSQSHPQTGLPPQGPTGQPNLSQSQSSFPQSTTSASQQPQSAPARETTYVPPGQAGQAGQTGHTQPGVHSSQTGQPSARSVPGPTQPRSSDPRSEYEPLETPRTPTSPTSGSGPTTTVSAQGGGSFWWAASQTRQWHLNEDILLFRHVERNGALNWEQAVPGRTAEEARIAW